MKKYIQPLLVCGFCILCAAALGLASMFLGSSGGESEYIRRHYAEVLPGSHSYDAPVKAVGVTVTAGRDAQGRLVGYCAISPRTDLFSKYDILVGVGADLTVTGVSFLPRQSPYLLPAFLPGDAAVKALISNKPILARHYGEFRKSAGDAGRDVITDIQSALSAARSLQQAS